MIAVTSIGGFFAFLFLIFGFGWIFDIMLKKKMTLSVGTPLYKEWVKPDLAVRTDIYLFSLANHDEFLNESKKAKLVQKGPYSFQEKTEKVQVVHHPENGTVSYKVKKVWHFDPLNSNGSLSDKVTTVNFPVMAALLAGKSMPWYMKWGLDESIKALGSQPFVTRSVRELLFDGYEDNLLSMAEMMGPTSDIPTDKFGWFYKRNGTSWGDGVFNTFTGASAHELLDRIHTHNHQTRTHFQGECGKIKGSADGMYPSFTVGQNDKSVNSMPDTLDMYSHQSCRSMQYTKSGRVVDHFGMATVEYEMDVRNFANGTTYPPNACYNNNLPSGLQNSSFCGPAESPIYLSFPHFYGADNFYLDQFSPDSDLKPDPEMHSSKMTLDPVLSVLGKFQLGLQLNVQLQKLPDGMADVPELYFPAIWFRSTLEMPEKKVEEVTFIMTLPQVVKMSSLACLLASILVIAIVLYQMLKTRVDECLYNTVKQASNKTRPALREMTNFKCCNSGEESASGAESNQETDELTAGHGGSIIKGKIDEAAALSRSLLHPHIST